MLLHVERALGRRAASEARLRRFAADASHELRTPLSAIRGYAELALRHPGPVPEDVMHALRRVQSESARMSVLVDDLLLLARLDAGPAARARAGGPVPAGHRDDERRAGGPRRPPMAAGPAGRAGHGARRRAPPAPGDGQPAEQRGQAHPGGFDGQRRARPRRRGHADGRHRGHRGGAARHRALGAAGGAEHHRRRPGHSARAAARTIRAVHPRRHGPRPGGQRRGEEHGPRPGHRGRRRRRARRLHHRDQPPGHDPVRHPPPVAARACPPGATCPARPGQH